MCFAKCGEGGKANKLCPVSFGLAIGVVCAVAMALWTLWVMYYGMPPMMAEMHKIEPTLHGGLMHALFGFIKGFLFGFFVALLYDCFTSYCCRRAECNGSPKQK